MSESCLVTKFKHYGDVSEREAEILEDLQREEREYSSGDVILSEGDRVENIFVVSSGSIFVARIGPGGDRQILDVKLAGDFVGLPEIGLCQSPSSIEVLADAKVCRFPKDRLNTIFEESAHLAGLFFSIAMREEAMLLERFVCLGRRPAYERMAHFMVETLQRLRVIGTNDGLTIEWPLTQAVLGDILGMSEVHANRTLRRLRDDGLIELDRKTLTICDERRMVEVAEFDPAYLEIDSSWHSSEGAG